MDIRVSLFLLRILIASFLLGSCQFKAQQIFNQEIEENIKLESTLLGVSVVADSLSVPWELVWGPDDWIWVTEERGYVTRINPVNGEKKVILRLPIGKRPEGAQAMIVHPDQKQYPYVYIHYKRVKSDGIRYNILERYTYQNDTLVHPKLLLEYVAGRGHTGSRLAFQGKERILWATGDQAIKEDTQDLSSANGKILRMDLEGNIPDDNPFPRSYVYAFGFRNMQGMVVTPQGAIYTSEHGDATDDEVNLIVPKGNYGYPSIEGMVDNDIEREFALKNNTIEPLVAWTPTIAPAGLDYYSSEKIPEWTNSLLLTMLKGQGLRVLTLDKTGKRIEREEVFLEKLYGRIRDLCISPAGDIYIATSNHDWNPMTSPSERDDRILRIARVNSAVKTPLTAKSRAEETISENSGEIIYQKFCFSCHKAKGAGLEGIYPALADSKVVRDKEKLLHILLEGSSAGDYAMPSFKFLKDEELFEIINYVRTSFGNKADSLSNSEIVSYRNQKR
ncbi:quinoprotein glucose dehydrogenase [Parapedobacter sp. SGR-10]|uniref:PQQ-dependent sugar dehydrogenase n=1 Tax=Parapedobacter sp. SGR-10 TaxID=2710879 RepID=UPI0013D72036|nr:PQQ-dependent sugar dehydrogenase [Parapedobacter sp. SGR-10]NGF56434.1 quinoprotein glucose dehydrogenase [Parapedobacter sp. SGR-10]